MKGMQISFLAAVACAAMVVQSEGSSVAKIKEDTIKWANEMAQWLKDKGAEFAQSVNRATANPNVNEDVKSQFEDFKLWASKAIPDLIQGYDGIKECATNATDDADLQKVKTDIEKIKNLGNDDIPEINKRAKQIYASINKALPSATPEGRKDLVEIREELDWRVHRHEAKQAETNSKGDAIAAQIKGRSLGKK